jgi:alpha-glucosidase
MDEAEVRDVARNFRERDIPCDVIYLDIHYMDGYRVFTWDRERFPDPEGLISDLHEQGFHVVTIVDPGVKIDEDYPVYVEGRERDLYCKTKEGEEYHNVVWPGMCAFPDFTSPEAREWWGENHRVLTDVGVDGIWCDMNEPALFVPRQSTMPDDVVHPGGSTGEAKWHAQIHNTYGSLVARAAREGLLKLKPDTRPFVITRAGYAGLQRHAMQWTGDNSSWWEHLWMSMPQLQNLGLSGVAWAGVDIGGFFDGRQRRVARPLDGDGRLPAVLPQPHRHRHPPPGAVGLRRALRVGLPRDDQAQAAPPPLPLHALRGMPPHRRPHPAPPPLRVPRGRDDLHGRRRVPPRRRPARRPHLPPRHRAPPRLPARRLLVPLLDRRTARRAFAPPRPRPLGQPAVYLKANTPLPMGPDAAHAGESATGPLTVLVHPATGAAPGSTTLYEDAGDGFGYENGDYARREVSCEASGDRVAVRFGAREGSFVPRRETILLELRGVGPARGVSVNGEDAGSSSTENGLVVTLPETGAETTVEVIP